jgi:hypothetical protein
MICAIAITTSTNATDYWISPKQDGTHYFGSSSYSNLGGSGTAGQTVEAAYYGDFDKIITDLPTGTNSVRLLPGIYYTKGDLDASASKWKANTRLIGSGMGVTTIRATGFSITNRVAVIRVAHTNANFSISDLTLEFEYGQSMPQHGTIGVALKGDNSRVNRVAIRSVFGSFAIDPANGEGFAIMIGNNASSTGGMVQDCVVTDTVGDYVTAIIAMGDTVVLGNRITFPTAIPAGYSYFKFFGVSPVDSLNATIADNFQYGGTVAVWQDTGSSANLVVSGNHFKRALNGVWFNLGASANQFTNIWVANNTIEMPSNATGVRALVTSPARIDKLLVSDNLITPFGGFAVSGSKSINFGRLDGSGAAPIFDWSIFGNTIPDSATYSLWPSGAGTVFDNINHFGQSLADGYWNENNQTAALPMSKYTFSGSTINTVQLTKEEAFVVVTGNTSVTNVLKLPEAGISSGWRYPGREVVLVNTAANPVIVQGYSGAEKINSAGIDYDTIEVGAHRLIRLISVDNRKWYHMN